MLVVTILATAPLDVKETSDATIHVKPDLVALAKMRDVDARGFDRQPLSGTPPTGRTNHGGDAPSPESSVAIDPKGVNTMYAAVRRYEGIVDDDEAARLVRDSFMPQLEEVPGFIAYYWIDAGEGVMASLSVFEDKAGADESVKFAHRWIEETAPGLFPQPPTVTEGRVVCHDNKER
jgi:hypothetical protein